MNYLIIGVCLFLWISCYVSTIMSYLSKINEGERQPNDIADYIIVLFVGAVASIPLSLVMAIEFIPRLVEKHHKGYLVSLLAIVVVKVLFF